MRDSWLKVVEAVLRPARPELGRCLQVREPYLAEQRLVAEERKRALANCEARIESARELVLAAGDGVISSRMTALEGEWRSLSRSDPDAGLMDAWARIAPPSWLDRKVWRDSPAAVRLDIAIALAADARGVAAAESAIDALRRALDAWGTKVGSRIRWCPLQRETALAELLLAEPLRAACDALSASSIESRAHERAHQLELAVEAGLRARLPERPVLARAIAHAAFVDSLFHAASLAARPNPMAALRELWATGYALSAMDSSHVTVEVAAL